jgi:hypothetical protein
MNPYELGIKGTTESEKSASYLDILPNIDSNGRLTTSLYDKRDDFDFAIVNFPFLCSNVSLSPAYCVYISQVIRYARARACFAYDNLQGYDESRLKSSFCKFYGLYNDLVCDYKLSLTHMLSDLYYTLCWAVVSIMVLTAVDPMCLVSTGGVRRVWPVGGECLLFHGA